MGISDIRAKVGRNPAVVDSFYLTLLQGVNQLLPLIVMPYLFATLGAGGYGHVGFALTVVQYLVLVVDFGFNYSATKDIAQAGDDRAERTRIFWAALKAKVLLMVAAVAVLLALIAFVPTFQKYSLALYCTLPMLVGNTFTFLWLFQGIGRIKLLTILNAVCKLCVLPFIFVCVKQPADFALAAFLQSSVYVLAAVVSGVVLYRLHAVDGPVGNMEDVRQALKRSFPLFVSTAASSVYTQLFVVVLAFFCSEEIIGQYSAAERLMRALCFGIFAPLNQAYFPRISAAAVSERGEARRLFRQVRLLVAAAMVVLAIALIGFAPLFPSIFGSDYAGIEPLLRTMGLAPISIGIGGVYGLMGLIALGNEQTKRAFGRCYIAAAGFALLCICVAIPLGKEFGAALSLLATETLVCCLMIYNYRKYKLESK